MAFGITPDGFVLKPLATIQSEIEDDQRAEIDPGLDLDARSAQGMLNGIESAALAELWELGQAAYSAAYPDSANDASLDNVASITGTSRSSTTKTTVPGVLVTLNPNKALPAGSVAHLASQPNARFVSDVEVPATAGGGVFAVDFTAESAGAISVAIGQLSAIAEPVSGWTVVTNPALGVTGEATETDAQLRIKRVAELEGGGSTNVDAIRANLLQDVAGVGAAAVFENDTDTVGPGLIPPHSVHAVVRGGNGPDIAQSIFATKAAGIATHGTEDEDVTDSQGNDHTIRWDFATEQDYFLTTTVLTDTVAFDAVDGPAAMKTAVAAYVNSLDIGGDILTDQVKCALLSIPGTLKVSAFIHGIGAPFDAQDILIGQQNIAISDVANIVTTITP